MKFAIAALCACTLLYACTPTEETATVLRTLPPTPETLGSNALVRCAAFVKECTPRDAGTDGAKKAAGWIAKSLEASGRKVEIDSFEENSPKGKVPFHNVHCKIPALGKSKGEVILLSHFDTKSGIEPRFEGANDGGSSTALLIEMALWLAQNPLAEYDVHCAFMDGEEAMVDYSSRDGFQGSKRFAAQTKAAKVSIRAVILMDMIGDRDLKILLPRNGAAELRSLALQAATATGRRESIGLCDMNVWDDHHAFHEMGYPAVDLIDFAYGSTPDGNEYWHTPQDTMDKLSPVSLQTTGEIVLEMLRRL